MQEREPKLITSAYSRTVTEGEITVELCICRLDDSPGWSLEVVNSAGTSIVWDALFDTDTEAKAEFDRTVREEGIKTFLDSATVIPFPRKR